MSKFILKFIKKTIFCVFCLLTLGIFITCDDPNNPFSNNLGPKVVVEQPTIYITSPDNNAFLKKDASGNVTITGFAKAYIKVEKVEWRVLANQMFEQAETRWAETGISKGRGADTKEWPSWTFTFNPGRFNKGRDGYITMQFRVFDSGNVSRESIPYMFKIKTKPSEINMTNPNADIILQDEDDSDPSNPAKPSEISWKGTINGQVVDVKGLRPGYPQIKFWPADIYPDGMEPPDDHPQWGWATLFLPGKGAPGAGEDIIEKDMGDYYGDYADRSQMRVVNTANFSLLLAEYDIFVPSSPGDPLYNPDFPVRLIRYRKEGGEFKYFEAGKVFNFRIRTSDTEPSPVGEKPTPNTDTLDGFFPPMYFGTPDEDAFYPRTEYDPLVYINNGVDITTNIKPVKIQIKSSDSRTSIRINNYDLNGKSYGSITGNASDTTSIVIPIKNPDGSAKLNEPELNPNIFITDPSSRKIDRTAGNDLFRLRLQVNQANGIKEATLTWQHDNTMRGPLSLAWDNPLGLPKPDEGFDNPFDVNGVPTSSSGEKPDGKIFTFTAKAGAQTGYHFYSHTEPYVLTFTVTASDNSQTVTYYTVNIDGDDPDVSIRSIRGAADVQPPDGAVNVAYTVNGNIQVIVDRTDPSSPIMTWKQGMGAQPPETDGYPMVKWIIESADKTASEPSTGIITKLNTYKSNPTPANLKFFNDIARERPPTSPELSGALASGWVLRPNTNAASDERSNHNFKFNTSLLANGYYWLYVIAQDQAQNLGFIVQKIYVDQSSDKPTVSWTNMSPTIDPDTPVISSAEKLEVKVEQDAAKDLTTSGNTSRKNVLLDSKDIELNLFDDDGIALSGITITLTDLNVSPNKEVTVPLDSNFLKGGKKARTYTLKQSEMAKLLYGTTTTETKLRDGLYKLDVSVTDDINEKVKIEQPQYQGMDPGDSPETADSGTITYYFAVYTSGPPKVVIEYPKPSTMGSAQPMTISGSVTSRLSVQNMWIYFDPDIYTDPYSANKSKPVKVDIFTDEDCTIPASPTSPFVAPTVPDVTPDSQGIYTFYWKIDGVIFQPIGAGVSLPPTREFTVEAYDRLGNRGSAGRSVQIDDDPPRVDLIEFNYNRPLDPEDGKLYLYGKVAFTVSATDTNGLYEPVVDGVTMSAIRWWVFKDGDTAIPPVWNTPFPEYTTYTGATPLPSGVTKWIGGGNFRRDQLKNGRYTGIIDTRWLTDKAEYKFYIIAMDNAGNTSRITGAITPDINLYKTFIVDQEKDKPVIDTNSLDPQPDSVTNANAVISGTVSDADLFNGGYKDDNGNLKKYVQIRFPSGFDTSGLPNAWSNGWIDINVPKTWDNKKGGIDPSGAIVYKFNVFEEQTSSPLVYVYTGAAADNARAYLNDDGIKYYQIRVTDEPVAPTQTEKDAGAKNYGKNPDLFMTLAPDNDYYPGYQYVAMGSVSKIFPLDDKKSAADPDAYKFIVDASDPEIVFDNFDPTKTPEALHPNYTGDVRPTYSKWEDLRDALSGKVVEYKLSTLSMSWSGKRKTTGKSDTITAIILNNPKDPPTTDPYNPTAGEYLWNLGTKVVNGVTRAADISTDDDTKLKAFFDDMPQGMHILSFEAVDMVGKTSRVTWIFSKDTKGPDINFTNITRAVKRPDVEKLEPPNEGTIISGTDPSVVWPSNWPSDWPAYRHDNTKDPLPLWRGWGSSWLTIILNWPSEYAFMEKAAVIAKLTAENVRNPSTVIGDPESKYGQSGYSPAVIEGTFSDDYSSVRILVPVANPDPTYFYYRFKNAQNGLARTDIPGGVPTKTEPDGSVWIQKTIEPQADGQNEKVADWKIVLDRASGFTGPDGENWVDIRVQDTAGNWSEIYNVRFVLDRTPPILGKEPNESGGPTDPLNITDADEFIIDEIAAISTWKAKPDAEKQLPEMQRVFSGAGATTTNSNMAFTLKGTVSDANLSLLQITIGHDSTSTKSYKVLATVGIDLQANTTPPNITSALDDQISRNDGPYNEDTGVKRLTVTRLVDLPDGTPQWEWTLKVLYKDIAELKDAAGTDYMNSARRYIRVIASDKAKKRVGPVDWYFYLDEVKPAIEYTNLDKGAEGECSSFETANFKLSGIVSDDTRIKDVQYMIGRWEYNPASGLPGWRWYNSVGTPGWTLTVPPATTAWPSAFESATVPTRLTSMNWVIDNETLNKSGKFPVDLFKNEGFYRLDLYVTDFSLGDGNPHNTYHLNDYISDDSANSFADKFYTSPTVGEKSGRVFYYDKDDPLLEWGWFNIDAAGIKIPDPADTTNTSNRTYFRNEDGKVNFSFTVGDGNTITEWSAKVEYTDDSGTTTALSSTTPTLKWETSKTSPSTIIPISTGIGTANDGIDPKAIVDQKLIIAPFMTSTGTASGTALDKLNGNTAIKTYTITITVKDGAQRTSSITKTFNLDNNPPDFIQDKFQPVSYKYKDQTDPAPSETVNGVTRNYSYDAVTGRLNIRGNTTDNSNQIKRVAFYVAPAGQPGTTPSYQASYNFRNPKDIPEGPPLILPSGFDTEEYWHWEDPENPGRVEIKIGPPGNQTTLMEIGGTFGWKINVPNTTIFRTSAEAQKYVQWTKTKKITGTPTTFQYRDVTFNGGLTPETITGVTTTSENVPDLRFADLGGPIYEDEDVGLITVYVMAEDAAGNIKYDLVKYWIWPEGDRPIVTAINNPDSTKIEAERLLNGTIRISGMAKDNERVKYVWFRVLDENGVPYTKLNIPVWNTTTWDEATPKAVQTPVNGSSIGALKSSDSLKAKLPTDSTVPTGSENGWYMANGGNSPQVSWWAYINTDGELNPTGFEAKKFTVEVRAQDTTYDDKNDQWMPDSYLGLASLPKTVDAWVVAGAPVFENQRVASAPSIGSDGTPIGWEDEDPSAPQYLKYSLDRVSIRNRSSYKVTVKHNSGLSSINWQPTEWNATTNAFQAVSGASYNLMNLEKGQYVYFNFGSTTPVTASQTAAFTALSDATATAGPRMAVTVNPPDTLGDGVSTVNTVTLLADRQYLVWKWDMKLESADLVKHDPDTHFKPGTTTHKDEEMKNTIISASASDRNADIGSAILIASEEPETIDDKKVYYFKWDVIVDVRADLLVGDLPSSYENKTAGRYKNSVHYPVYLSASEVSKATPFTTRGDALLPIDQLPPTGTYTLNRRPAGSAVSIGGEAGDEGPVNGVARVVLWFQRGSDLISWHETARTGITTLEAVTEKNPTYTDGTNPAWWQNANLVNNNGNPVVPIPGTPAAATVKKPNIGPETKTSGNWVTDPVGNYAIVIDRNSPSNGQDAWGHNLPMGFADGGMGKYWYVVINSYGIESGPVDLHYVVIDKAGNATYYKEKLIIMNDVAKINKIRLATDIRDNAGFRTGTGAWTAPTRVGGPTSTGGTPTTTIPGAAETYGRNTILQRIWEQVPLGTNYVQKGITDEIYSVALGADKIIDFNVRNSLFALRVETTAGAGGNKARHFRLEYVSGAERLYDTAAAGSRLTDMKAGRVYIIDDPGTARWGAIGAEGDGPWQRGYAFLAAIDGMDGSDPKITGTGSVWELNSAYYNTAGARALPTNLNLGDVVYSATVSGNDNATSAEFVYNSTAFGTAADSTIVDTSAANDAYPPNQGTSPVAAGHSMFILRVFDGPETDMFGDFTIIRVRVNNNDRTKPFAQLYDINPKTEGQDRQNIAGDDLNVEQTRSVSPMFIGEGANSNRTKGGLWNTAAAVGAVTKPGHIEPRKMTGTGYTHDMYAVKQGDEDAARNHSLSSEQMGGARIKDEATIQKPWADPAGFFSVDTVSGRVVLRGYAEDNEQINRVQLQINGNNFDILDRQAHSATGEGDGAGTPGNSANYQPPRTGLLKVASNANTTNNRVYFTDSIDLYRHRVEWAYIWDTETLASTPVVGSVTVRVVAYNRSTVTANQESAETAEPGNTHSNTSTITDAAYTPNTSPRNPGFPAGLNEYNRISFNLRPYITGFKRNQATFAHDTRSRQGRYMFARDEMAVVTGFNFTTGTNVTISIPGMSTAPSASAVAAPANFGISDNSAMHYRQFTVGGAATSSMDSGVINITVNNSSQSVNTGADRTKATGTPTRPAVIQPWNKEYSPGKDGTDLWDDFTQAHIWQSNDTTGDNGGRFASTDKWVILSPAMSIDPTNGTLYESHNESGSTGSVYNIGTTRMTPITATSTATPVMQFVDPIFFSDVYRSPGSGNQGADTWVVSSIIGRASNDQHWAALGGIYIRGPGGGSLLLANGGSNAGAAPTYPNADQTYNKPVYHGESTWYNASSNATNPANPRTTDQFMNPHIVTSYTGTGNSTVEHIHVSYYDDKDGSIKYRYNLRGQPGTLPDQNTSASNINSNTAKMWTNLDGGVDQEDLDQTIYTNSAVGTGNINANTRVVRYTNSITATKTARGNIDAGKHNSIAVTSQGYPVIAYYDQTNQRLKLAVSNSASPILANNWIIRDYVIPEDDKSKSSFGTGEFVSMKIDTTNNRVHIAAMNTSKRLVYITGTVNPNFTTGNTQQTSGGVFTFDKAQVVDSVGNVGRWCALSLDSNGNPWISYMDESYVGARDGAKVAFLNKTTFYKGVTGGTYFPGQYVDLFGNSLEGWETMHVPTTYRVENPVEGPGREHGRLGMECWPTRILPNVTNNKIWIAAVSYLSQDAAGSAAAMDRYRVAYYVK